MFVKRKKNRSGSISVVIAEKISGRYSELATIGIAQNEKEVEKFVQEGREWIERENQRRHPRLDLFGEERSGCEAELLSAEQMLSCISNITIDGADLILDRVFDNVGFNRIGDDIFRKLVKARLSYPASKAATVEYLKNHFDEDISLSKIYRYLDKLSDSQHQVVQDISVEHTREDTPEAISECCSMMSQRCILKRITRMICARQVSQRGTAQEPSDNTWSAGQHRRLPVGLLHSRGQ